MSMGVIRPIILFIIIIIILCPLFSCSSMHLCGSGIFSIYVL